MEKTIKKAKSIEIIVIFNLFLSSKNFIENKKKIKNKGIVTKSKNFENETSMGLSKEVIILVKTSK